MNERAVGSCPEVIVDLNKQPIRVLHVDNELGLLKVAKQCLELQGPFHVDTAGSVEEALAKLEKEQYDAVISDYQMPEEDGLEFLKQLRNEGNEIPFIILTGKGREEVAIGALNLGADQYIDKRGDPETMYCELAHSIRVAVERKKSKDALFAERDRLETVTRSISAGLAIISKDYRILWANDVLKQMVGDLEGKICYSFYTQRSDVCTKCGVQEIFGTEKSKVVYEQVGKDVDGKTTWSEITATPVKDRDGNITAALELVVPITQRKIAEKELHDSEEKYRKLFDEALDAIFVADAETGIIVDCNHAATELVGREKSELIGKHQRILYPPEENEGEFSTTFKQHLKEKEDQTLEMQVITQKGEIKDVAVKANILELGNKRVIQGIFKDITELKKAEEEIRSLAKFPSENPSPVLRITKDGIILYANAAAKSLLSELKTEIGQLAPRSWRLLVAGTLNSGAKKEIEVEHGNRIYLFILAPMTGTAYVNMYGFDITERKKAEAELRRLATIVTDSNDAVTVVDMNRRITAWNKGAEDTYGYRKDEALGMDILEIVPEDKKQETLDVIGNIKMNETVGSFETKRLAKDGRVLDVWLTVTKLVDDKGNAVALATTERDVTEKKRLEEKLRFSEKFTVLGQLSSSVAHEIRNPLGVIKNSVYFLNIRLKEHADEKVVKHLRIMEQNVNSADRVISDLLDVARHKVGALELADLNRILERAFASLSVPENINVITKLDKIPKMLLDPERIQRVFVNMIQNAVAAMPKGGKLTVGISRSGDSVKISFKDSGVGIPEENMQKLFTPMFTTKTKGLGLGLAICKQIVEGHNGDIAVRSKAGEGALFIVRLPILSETELVRAGLLQADLLIGGMNE